MGQSEKLICSAVLCALLLSSFALSSSVPVEERCRDDSFCKAYCLSTNPETVSARCGRDLASCICITPDNHAVKVRFIEERNPVPPTVSTTPRPATSSIYATSPSNGFAQSQYALYNGNGNSLGGSGSQHQQQQQQQHQHQNYQQQSMTPVLLECDASESSTRTCHLFCTMEIRAWYGLCNITSKACACFGIPLSAVQQEPIAAIFHSTAPSTPAPATTARPTYPPARPQGQQQYPLYQYPQQQQPQRPPLAPPPQQPVKPVDPHPWRPIPPSYQPLYNYYQHPNAPTVLNPALQPQQGSNNQLSDQGPVRSVASLFGPNGQPVSSSFVTPADTSTESSVTSSVSSSSQHESSNLESDILKPAEETEDEPTTTPTPSRKKRSINDTPLLKGKDSVSDKEKGEPGNTCTRFKCALSCKRNNYFAPDCQPKCIDDECWCECFPRL